MPFDVHLMIVEPERLIAEFVAAGADKITVHQEAVPHLHDVVQQIKRLGASAGVAINPATPASTLEAILPDLDLVLVLTVNPGFGGQTLIESALPKVTEVRGMIDAMGLATELEVDGGIKADNVQRLVDAGAGVIVAGSAVYNDQVSISQAIADLRAGIARSTASSTATLHPTAGSS
jgi:ribulose-phosphate 3-epimerase